MDNETMMCPKCNVAMVDGVCPQCGMKAGDVMPAAESAMPMGDAPAVAPEAPAPTATPETPTA